MIGPEAVLGIEVNPYAAELARVSVWIGHIQWARRNGYPPPSDPVLRSLDTIECRDAVLAADGTPASWPQTNAIVGNPPFLGDKAMFGTLGENYTRALRDAYAGRVPGGADLVCYWFEKAKEAIEIGQAERAGLVATNSIRGGANRRVLDRICESSAIFEAWSDEPWTLDGASVRVSLVCFAPPNGNNARLNGLTVPEVFADLTGGSTDLTQAVPMVENSGVALQGPTKGGPFEVPGDIARNWLKAPLNANGSANRDVVRPWWSGDDVTGRPRDLWLIDFAEMPEADAAYFAQPYAHVAEHVRPIRQKVTRERRRRLWWQFNEPAPGLRRAVSSLTRFIVTPEVSKHRLFVWCPASVLPDKNLVVIAREDDTAFGILHSRFHAAWALRLGTSLEDRPRYTSSTTFRTFPLPNGLTPDIPASNYALDPRARRIAEAARALVKARDLWLNPPDLVERLPEVVPGFPTRLLPVNAHAAALLRRRTLTSLYNTRGTPEGAWLDSLHRKLDEAVAAAYGWSVDISADDALAHLLVLNRERA
jgi:type II restriction/modification system DNA methylase subunit YeeA